MDGSQKEIIHNYERKKEFWISGKQPCDYADIWFSDIGELELHIKEDFVYVCGNTEVFYNRKKVENPTIKIYKGDLISFAQYEITFFERWIEIKGDLSNGQVSLIKTNGDLKKFKDFPYYKRSPRVIYHIAEESIEIQEPPQKKEISKGSIFQLILPTLSTAALTVVMGIVMKRGTYVYLSLGMTIVTLMFSIKNFISQNKEVKEENKNREEIYLAYLMKCRKRIRRAREKEQEAINYQFPQAESLEEMIKGYSSRLYERSFMDEDFLQINLGYYAGSSTVKVSSAQDKLEVVKDPLKELAKEIPREYGRISGIPMAVDLKKAHLGLVGSKKNVHEQLKYILFQLTFFHSYHDLQIIFLHNEAYKDEFSYVKWYPHLQIRAINVTGDIYTLQARDQIFGSIQQILKDRKIKQKEEKQNVTFTPHLLFIIDEPVLILNHPVMEYLQSKEIDLGFSFIYCTDQQENLPENVRTVCLLENSEDGRLLLNEGRRVNRSFRIPHVSGINLEHTARIMSAIIHEQGMHSQIPESITFFEMYQIEHPKELNVAKRWQENESHKSLAVPLGVRAKEDYVDLNLHEKAHGPHGLVAGTTGSGKSEIVQSYILSLAVNFHPHEVGFLLIDYKGGGMANLFADLPHLLGTITNLDKAESMRAMASIKSELSRRQQIFSDSNVNHINGYNKLFKLGKVEEPLPHLFLISDEFAELKKEQPEFMSELVSAARIGRSLGIHLILATQKPSGVVDDQIWTNSKFKLCLKVQNEGDSREMLKTPDAANITQAGRSYLQVGNNEIYELFQSAWSGASYQKDQTVEEKEDDRVYLLNELGQGVLLNQDLSGPKESNQLKATQLDVVVTHLKEVYEKTPSVEVKKPWLPSLPTMLLSPYTQSVTDSKEWQELDTTLGLGMMDIPQEQAQTEYVLDFLKNGHLLYMASSGYGKSMVLGHIILGLSMKNAVERLNIYILDFGNSALIAYKGLPHVADYMGIDDTEKLEKFKMLIMDMMSERKKLLAKAMAQNFHVYNQTQEEKLKCIVLILDNYDIVGEVSDELISFIQKASRDGAGLGIYLVVTMTRENAMRAVTEGNFKERIAGFNFVEGENNSFIGRSQIQIPEDKKGRALVKQDSINLMQMYVPVSCEDEIAYNQNLKELIRRIAEASTEERAKGIPVLPEVLKYNILPQYPAHTQEAFLLPVGLDVDTLEIKYLNLMEGPGLVVGAGGSGRTNTVKTLLKHAEGKTVYVFDNEDSMLRPYESHTGIRYACGKEGYQSHLEEIEALVADRREQHEEERIDDVTLTLKAFGQRQEPVYIVLDSLQQIYEGIDDNARFDIFMEAQKCGCYILATSDIRIRKTMGSEFMTVLADSAEGLVLGNIRDQSVFSYVGIREDNRSLELGYYHKRGKNWKIKLIEN